MKISKFYCIFTPCAKFPSQGNVTIFVLSTSTSTSTGLEFDFQFYMMMSLQAAVDLRNKEGRLSRTPCHGA